MMVWLVMTLCYKFSKNPTENETFTHSTIGTSNDLCEKVYAGADILEKCLFHNIQLVLYQQQRGEEKKNRNYV